MAPLLAVLQKLLRPLQPVTMTQLSPKKPQYALHLASSQRRLYSSRVCQLSPRGSFGGLVWRARWGCSCGCKQTYIGDRRTASHPCATWGGWCSAPFAGISSHMSCIRTCLCHCTVFGNRWKMRYPAIIYQYEKITTDGRGRRVRWNPFTVHVCDRDRSKIKIWRRELPTPLKNNSFSSLTLKVFPQNEHIKGLSPVWLRWCFFSPSLLEYSFPQKHLKISNPILWTYFMW